MPALVTELVNAAIDQNTSVADLLRRALVAARRLGVPELTDWISAELNGYHTNELPEYRLLRGTPICEGELGGWMPLEVRDPEMYEKMTQARIATSIPELEQLAADRGSSLVVFYPQKIELRLMAAMKPRTRPAIQVAATQVLGVISLVRDRILQWALDLEGSGVLGEGMSFTQEERQIVAQQHYHFGDVSGSQIQIGSAGANQHQQVIGGDLEALNSLIAILHEAIEQGQLNADALAELQAEVKTLEAQASSPKPKWPIIKATALSIKTVLEGAAGNVLASKALPLLAALI